MTTRLTAALLASACLAAGAPAALAAGPAACTGAPGAHVLRLRVDNVADEGYVALPRRAPRGIVVFDHGHGHNAADWRADLVRTAARDGVIAIAMNYHGEDVARRYGWKVREGADDSIAAAQLFAARCPMARTIVDYGTSMGGNTAGLAAAVPAKRPGGAPLFDYLFLVEPITDVTETYLEAEAVHAALPTNATAAKAITEIEQEMGGPLTDPAVAPTYLHESDVTRGDDIKAAGIRGAVLVHDVDDGEAGYNQTQEMAAVLLREGIPTDVFTTTTRQPGNKDDDTWLDGYATGSVPGYNDPFVGHGDENSTTQLNIQTGFARLAALFGSAAAPHCRQFVVDGLTGTTTPDPGTPGAC